MLDDPNSHITVGGYGAYAVIMARGKESLTATGTTKWQCTNKDVRPFPADRGVLSLMANMRNHMDVRVLRYWKLSSKLAPKAGLRYDGQ